VDNKVDHSALISSSGVMEQAPIKIGQYVRGKNLGIGAFGKVSFGSIFDVFLMSCLVKQVKTRDNSNCPCYG
jgi:hypothetical protein